MAPPIACGTHLNVENETSFIYISIKTYFAWFVKTPSLLIVCAFDSVRHFDDSQIAIDLARIIYNEVYTVLQLENRGLLSFGHGFGRVKATSFQNQGLDETNAFVCHWNEQLALRNEPSKINIRKRNKLSKLLISISRIIYNKFLIYKSPNWRRLRVWQQLTHRSHTLVVSSSTHCVQSTPTEKGNSWNCHSKNETHFSACSLALLGVLLQSRIWPNSTPSTSRITIFRVKSNGIAFMRFVATNDCRVRPQFEFYWALMGFRRKRMFRVV